MRTHAIAYLIAFPLILAIATGLGIADPIKESPTTATAAVPGTELHDNVAYIKTGYHFVNSGASVQVVQDPLQKITGNYTCPCPGKDKTKKCRMEFTPRRITCRIGTCAGRACLLTASAPISRQ
ncbi:MAG: hypothetical protein ABIP75_07760 [Pyrinomonadaceae bacterium]